MNRAAAQARVWTWLAALPPLLAYAFVLQRLWADAPIWDDYGILDTLVLMADAPGARDWWRLLLAQHNEHRIVVTRLAALALDATQGRVDFRALIVLGNLAFLGVFVMICREFRARPRAGIVLAAALLMFHGSYYEAALWASGGLPNMGAALFSFACIGLATSARAGSAAMAILLAALAVGSAANGLFALPIAAAGCWLLGKRRRGLVLALSALALGALYFIGYVRPPYHPSPLLALQSPLSTLQLFLIVVGGMVPGRWLPIGLGIALLAAIGWLFMRRGFWKAHPVASLWIVFILVSAAAAAAGRVGFGVFHASRYSIYSTCLAVIVFLAVYQATYPWSVPRVAGAIAAALALSVAATVLSWRELAAFALNARLLAKTPAVAEPFAPQPYFGMYFPNLPGAIHILRSAEHRGIYAPREVQLFDSRVVDIAAAPLKLPVAGHIDEVQVAGNRVTAIGWTDIPATVQGRRFSILAAATPPSARSVRVIDRSDAARERGDPRLVFSGFRLELDYASSEDARAGAASLCLVVEAPAHAARVLYRADAVCPRGGSG